MAEAVGTTGLAAGAQDRAALNFHCDDLDAAAEELRSRGASFIVEPTARPDWGIKVAHFRDPDGNLIEINSPMPTTEWTEELREEAAKLPGAPN
jgi:predicted enzyme related to lactoylglutathione lyase